MPVGTNSSERFLFCVGLISALALLLYIAWPLLQGKLYVHDDLGNYHIPARAFYAKCLANGFSYDWWPNIYCGYYLQGDGQVGMYHPFHRFLYSHLGLSGGFAIELFIGFPVMLVGMYVFLRRLAFARDASIFGALVFTFSGFNLLHFCHIQAIEIVAELPWLLIAVDVSLRGANRFGVAIANLAVAVLVVSDFLLGYPQYVWLSALIAGLYALYLIGQWQSTWRVVPLVLFAACGVVAGSVQLLPTYDALKASARLSGGAYDPFTYSLNPLNVFQFVAPYLFGGRVITGETVWRHTTEYGIYDGAIVFVMFLMVATGAVRLGGRRRLSLGLVALAVISLVLAFGRSGGLYTAVTHVPLVGRFRAPARYVLLVQFAFAIGAAVFLEAVREKSRAAGRLTRRAKAILVLVPIAALATLVLSGRVLPGGAASWAALSSQVRGGLLAALSGPLLAIAAVLIVFAALRGSKLALAVAIVFTAADLGVYGLTTMDRKPQTLATFAQTVNLPEVAPGERIEAIPTRNDIATLKGLHQVTGYVGLPPAKALDYARPNALRLACAAYMSVPARSAEGGAPGALIIPVAKPMPRARLVTAAVVATDPRAEVERIDIESTALVSEPLELGGGAAGTATIDLDVPGHIEVVTQAPSRQLLVLSESFHRGWRATVDGDVAKVIPVCGDFIGVVVGDKRRNVVLDFKPESLSKGILFTKIGLTAMVLLFLVTMLAARKAKSLSQ